MGRGKREGLEEKKNKDKAAERKKREGSVGKERDKAAERKKERRVSRKRKK